LSRRLLQQHPNLYMSLRMEPGRVPENFPLTRDRQIKPEWLQLLKDFPTRFVIGSDQFLAGQSFHGSDLANQLVKKVPMTRELTPVFLRNFPADIAHKIAIENAVAIYKLND